MKTLHEFGEAVVDIREALKTLRIEATTENCSAILYCQHKCNDIIKSINEAAKSAPPGDVDVQLTLVPKEGETNADDR